MMGEGERMELVIWGGKKVLGWREWGEGEEGS